jgi:glucose/arabinose dehydrogenase
MCWRVEGNTVKSKPAFIVILVVILGLLLPPGAEAEFTGLPAGFTDELVVSGLPAPTAIDWLPDGDLLIATQGGGLYRQSGANPPTLVLNLAGTICSGGETGLLGLAVDPGFTAGSRFIYLYYTDKKTDGVCGEENRANRVSRFNVDGNGAIGGEVVLIDNIPAPGGNHNGGDLQFDRNGLLYVAVGDGGRDLVTNLAQNDNANARRLDLLNGKILRIHTNGVIPADNPFLGANSTRCSATGQAPAELSVAKKKKNKKKRGGKGKKNKKNKKKHKNKKKKRKNRGGQNQNPTPNPGQNPVPSQSTVCQEIFATGLRNPFRIAFDPDDVTGIQRFYINDVGGGAWEEISEGVPGADYGWNIREGPCPTGTTTNCAPDGRFVEPLFAYPHGTGCRTITGGAFVPDAADWPAAYDNVYLSADFICDKLFVWNPASPGQTPQTFGTGSGATQLAFGPDGALYYTAFDGGGQVRRIVFTP